jgi:hypothetical protein
VEEVKKNNGGGYRCWMCQGSGTIQKGVCSWCYGGKHRLLRWLLVLVVLVVVFCVGVKLGELKTLIGNGGYRGSRHYYMMGPGANYGPNSGYYAPMMRGWYGNTAPQPATTTQK